MRRIMLLAGLLLAALLPSAASAVTFDGDWVPSSVGGGAMTYVDGEFVVPQMNCAGYSTVQYLGVEANTGPSVGIANLAAGIEVACSNSVDTDSAWYVAGQSNTIHALAGVTIHPGDMTDASVSGSPNWYTLKVTDWTTNTSTSQTSWCPFCAAPTAAIWGVWADAAHLFPPYAAPGGFVQGGDPAFSMIGGNAAFVNFLDQNLAWYQSRGFLASQNIWVLDPNYDQILTSFAAPFSDQQGELNFELVPGS